jgi:glc operon protein GlcG
MTHERAVAIVDAVVATARAPVSVVVVDDHGETVASLRMDGAALDTHENARRKAYTAARSDAFTTRELAAKAASSATERASFDPQFSFFLGGVAVLDEGRRVGAVGVSGLPGEEDHALASAAVQSAGLDAPV